MQRSRTRKILLVFGIIEISLLGILVLPHLAYFENRKAGWMGDALDAIRSGRYPRIKAISYWNENWPNSFGLESQLRLDSSPAALNTYRTKIADPIFIATPVFEPNAQGGLRLAPSPTGIYHNAYPDFDDTEDKVTAEAIRTFETLAQKPIMWVYMSNNWIDGTIAFPSDAFATILAEGKIPYIRLMARSSSDNPCPDPIFSMQKIIDGEFDAPLQVWAQNAKAMNRSFLCEFGTEVNADWFAWNGVWNGGQETGYGNTSLADGPERFVLAYRHIIDLFRAEQCVNMTWVFHADCGTSPEEGWNRMGHYYPGDDYIDWIGLSNYGPLTGWETWDGLGFTERLDLVYEEVLAISIDKPLAILEFGADENGELGVPMIGIISMAIIGCICVIWTIIARKRS